MKKELTANLIASHCGHKVRCVISVDTDEGGSGEMDSAFIECVDCDEEIIRITKDGHY